MKKLKNSRLSTDCRKLQTLALNLSRKNSNGQLMKKSEKARSLFFIQKCGRETFVFLLHGLTGTQLQAICGISKDTINWNLMDSQSTHVSMVAIGGFHAISGDTNNNGEINKCWSTNWKRANERSFVYRPPAWRRWRNVKTTYKIYSSL